jgi:hypothetical protein
MGAACGFDQGYRVFISSNTHTHTTSFISYLPHLGRHHLLEALLAVAQQEGIIISIVVSVPIPFLRPAGDPAQHGLPVRLENNVDMSVSAFFNQLLGGPAL